MKCPFCSSNLSKVIDKRAVLGRGEIRRRRECLKCSKRYTTYETKAEVEVLVVKRDGRKELFIREKLEKGLSRALEKRPGIDKVSGLIDRIEGRIRLRKLTEITSQTLGKWVLSDLKKLDQVAYMRFASVYRSFGDPNDFAEELKTL